ncbi:uncharacterized protein LOC108899419 isoform X1 [Xyrichtys novacula]|uniref:Uncharacterized protein LOC108899419 isoform X1 n=1 Tax=Xyrichtys novacula TaxID=13765 RepID=A0AAV1FPG4_XYRNO|nr:uncharacterized protein LOC108899419 isoform X1 [Xyrichtys novacula]
MVGKCSSVKTIPKEEPAVLERTKRMEELLSKLTWAEENYPQPQKPQRNESAVTTAPKARPVSHCPDEEVVKTSWEDAIFDKAPCAASNPGHMAEDMDLKRRLKPNSPPRRPLKQRNNNRRVKRSAAAVRKWFLLFLMASHVPVSEGLPGSTEMKCYNCTDLTRCSSTDTIYDKEKNHKLYERDQGKPLPDCNGTTTPTGNNICAVCNNTSTILIYCPKNVTSLDVEGGGVHIENISSVCPQQQTPGHGHGVIAVAVVVPLILLVVVGVLLYCVSGSTKCRGHLISGSPIHLSSS